MLRLKPKLKGALLTLAGLALLLLCLWIWIGIRIGIWTYPQYDRHIWLVETIPVAHALWSGQIHAEDSAAELSRDWHPDKTEVFGPWTKMEWYPGGASNDSLSFIGIDVIARNGRLVIAGAYSDDGLNNRVFFDTETTQDKKDFDAEYKQSMPAKLKDGTNSTR